MADCTIITGAASGIGRETARRLAEKRERILAVDMDAGRLHEVYDGVDGVDVLACDLLEAGAIGKIADAVKAMDCAVKGFVHCAGFDCAAPLGIIDVETMKRMFALHAVFPVEFFGWWSRKGNHADSAAAVLVSSLAAHEAAKGHVAYAAAKGAVEGMLKPAAAELIVKGIRLNEVVFGAVDTEMTRTWLGKLPSDKRAELVQTYPLGLGRPEDAASAIVFLLSRDAHWIAGSKLVCDGGHLVK